MFFVFEIIAFERIGGISLIYDENTCDRRSTRYETLLNFWTCLRKIFSNSICRRLMENCDKSAAVEVLALFWTREHFDSRRVF